MHNNSLKLFEIHAKPLFKDGMRVLEVAPESIPSTLNRIVHGQAPVVSAVGAGAALSDRRIRWESINLIPEDSTYVIPTDGLTYTTTKPYEYPMPSDTYDIVVSANVFEHVPMPWRWMKELARVCKPGGRVVTLVPLNWGYHAEPIDCWRPYPQGIGAVYEDAGLKVEKALFATTDTWRSRCNVAGVKYFVKRLIKWPVKGEPLFAWDTICIGTKP